MPRRIEQPFSTLATRLPKSLHHALRVYCVENRVQVRDFVIRAVEERLAKESRKPHVPT